MLLYRDMHKRLSNTTLELNRAQNIMCLSQSLNSNENENTFDGIIKKKMQQLTSLNNTKSICNENQ